MPESSQGASPKSPRYFYRNKHLHRAICMIVDHEMQLLTHDGKELVISDGMLGFWEEHPLQPSRRVFIGCGDHFYIHPDSLHLLEPRAADIVLDDGRPSWCSVRIVHDDRIVIQRNGIPFHWPEREAA